MNRQDQPFTVERVAQDWSASSRRLFSYAVPALDRVLGLKPLAKIYKKILSGTQSYSTSVEFIELVHEHLGVVPDVREESLRRIPKTGPLIVVSNHTFGGIEATILRSVLSAHRRRDCAADDLIDALVLAVGDAFPHYESIPDPFDVDSTGLPMRIVCPTMTED